MAHLIAIFARRSYGQARFETVPEIFLSFIIGYAFYIFITYMYVIYILICRGRQD